jgi:DNA-binding PadR family transcriptional regulator
MILGLLAERGPMHGHQIRRTAELTNAEVWGGITGGALYAELRKLNAEGLIEAVREERVGRRPARTVYQITGDGRLELVVQRDAAFEIVFGSADPLSVLLLFAAGADPAELSERLAERRRRIEGQLEAMVAERERLTGQGVLPPLAVAAFRRGELRLEAELRWHAEFGRQLAVGALDVAGAAGARSAAGAAGARSAAGAAGARSGADRPVRAVDRR